MGCLLNCCKDDTNNLDSGVSNNQQQAYPDISSQSEQNLIASFENNNKFQGYINQDALKKLLSIIFKTNSHEWFQYEDQLLKYQSELAKYKQIIDSEKLNSEKANNKFIMIELQKVHLLISSQRDRFKSPVIKLQINLGNSKEIITKQSQIGKQLFKESNQTQPGQKNVNNQENDNIFQWMEVLQVDLSQETDKIKENEKNQIEIIHRKSTSYDQNFFKIQLIFQDMQKKKLIQIGLEQTISFFELADQQIHTKILSFRKSQQGSSYANLLIRAQLIKDYKTFLNQQEIELHARAEQINKLLKYIDDHPEDKKRSSEKSQDGYQEGNSQIQPSLYSHDDRMSVGDSNSNSFYNHQFVAK